MPGESLPVGGGVIKMKSTRPRHSFYSTYSAFLSPLYSAAFQSVLLFFSSHFYPRSHIVINVSAFRTRFFTYKPVRFALLREAEYFRGWKAPGYP